METEMVLSRRKYLDLGAKVDGFKMMGYTELVDE